jgi:hypothetical protein
MNNSPQEPAPGGEATARYGLRFCGERCDAYLAMSPTGNFVAYADYDTLAARVAELEADKARLDWLEDAVSGGHIESAFEMDGGVHLTVCMAGDEPLELRDKNSLREAIDAALGESK